VTGDKLASSDSDEEREELIDEEGRDFPHFEWFTDIAPTTTTLSTGITPIEEPRDAPVLLTSSKP